MRSLEAHPKSPAMCLLQEDKAFLNSTNKGKEKVRNEGLFYLYGHGEGRVNVERRKSSLGKHGETNHMTR